MIEIENDVPVLRQISVHAVMEYLLHSGPASRAEMAKATTLSKQTISEVILTLEERGWVRPCGLASGKVGRAAMNYEISDDLFYVLGMDVGATTIRLSLVNLRGKEVAHYEDANDNTGGDNLVKKLCQLKDALLASLNIEPRKLHSVSMAIPGVVNQQTGTLSFAPNMNNMEEFKLLNAMRHVFNCEVLIENDVNAAAIGEYWRGHGQDAHSLAFISLGTGVGLGLLLEGILLRGAMGAAGEISYLPLGADAYASENRHHGTLESAIGASGISRRYHFAGGLCDTPVRDILNRYVDKEPAALIAIEETARIAALLVLSVSSLFDPEKIIIGGNIGTRPELVERISYYLHSCAPHPIVLECSTLGAQATLTGAVAISLNKLHNLLFGLKDFSKQVQLPKNI
ncbi:ROK family transcriptional regulator [Kosakonia sp. S42]|uniref:ROK family transcriptional regulator n=1 Tax=Kosakonia sp. S42 TaxID=2767458 RepID=UPI00190C5073|nr:ROK family transcriptional regulator [Kosakonia sp. S42]MBK0019003.1 ROK family transcriptional regulator [Kosakonia sp. S42]